MFIRSKLAAIAVFVGSAICMWLVIVGIAWIAQRTLGLSRPATPPFASVNTVSKLPVPQFADAVRERLLSAGDCAAALSQMDGDAILSMLHSCEPAFWRANPNSTIFIRQAGRALCSSRGAESVLGETKSILWVSEIPDARKLRLLVAAFSGVLEAVQLPQHELVSILRDKEERTGIALLEVWLDFQKPGTPKGDFELAKQIIAQAFHDTDPRLEGDVAAMIVRLWAHRAPSVGDVLQFSTKFENTRNHNRLLYEGAHLLSVAAPEELKYRLVQFAPVMSREAGQIAAEAGLPFAEAVSMAAKMSDKDKASFLTSYLRALRNDDPREMSKVAEKLSAKDLKESAAGEVIAGLAATGDLHGLKEWIGSADPEMQTKLWDKMMDNLDFASASAARFYLTERPADAKPNIWAAKAALNALPYEEAMRLLPLAGKREGQFVTQLPEEISRNELTRLRNEDPDRIPEFLAIVPSDYRSKILDSVLGKWSDPDPQAMQAWADATSDPKLKAELHQLSLRNDLAFATIAEAQARLSSLLQTGQQQGAYAEAVKETLQLQSSSASALAFLTNLPPGELKDSSTISFARQWSALDPPAASEWLAELPPGRTRDLATRELISAARDDPERALANAAGMQDPKLRFEAARIVLRVWRDGDPDVTAAALGAAGFSPEELPMLRAMAGLQNPSSPP